MVRAFPSIGGNNWPQNLTGQYVAYTMRARSYATVRGGNAARLRLPGTTWGRLRPRESTRTGPEHAGPRRCYYRPSDRGVTLHQLRRVVPLRGSAARDAAQDSLADRAAIGIEGLHKGFLRQGHFSEVISDLTLTLHRGESGSLIGPSGCGKSTLLRIIAGLERYQQGEVTVHGRAVTGARRDVGFMFQGLALLPWRSVSQNVRLPGELLGMSRNEIAQRAERCLSLVGLTGYEKYPLRQISGGMRQRVALARLLMTDTKLLLLDEPFSSLDEFTRETIDVLFMDVAAKTETDYLMVTHSIPEAVLMSDKIFVLSPPPARLLATIDVPLPRPRTKEIQDDAVFHEVTREVRDVLRAHMG